MDCGVHAREWISHSVCQYFVGQIVNPNSQFAALRDGIEWHVIPNVNPDGYAFSWTQGLILKKKLKVYVRVEIYYRI